MPNFDGGHYFLTVLAPINGDAVPIGDGRYRSHVNLLRETLTRLPTAQQNRVTRDAALNSPFARNRLNHLARFVVIDDVVFNGRRSSDALIGRLTGDNPVVPQPVDRLRCSYLLFGADIDAGSGDDTALRAYTDALWGSMRDELSEIFGHCLGFDGVTDAAGFFAYIRRCQVETTMPFNDYWTTPIPAKPISVPLVAAPVAIAALVTLIALVMQLFGFGGWPWGWILLLGAAATVGIGAATYYWLVAKAQAPFPTAPDSDLPSVLKGLYLQQRFADFAIDQQGVDAEALYQAFGAFIARERPADTDQPTQPPGVLSAARANAGANTGTRPGTSPGASTSQQPA